ncbi:MAG: hypothetical protein QM781_15755 [Chitinophagaceae bacterium]
MKRIAIAAVLLAVLVVGLTSCASSRKTGCPMAQSGSRFRA